MNEILIKTCDKITADFSVGGLFQLVGIQAAPKRNTSWELGRGGGGRGLHDTGATSAPQRVPFGSLSWLYICLDVNTPLEILETKINYLTEEFSFSQSMADEKK